MMDHAGDDVKESSGLQHLSPRKFPCELLQAVSGVEGEDNWIDFLRGHYWREIRNLRDSFFFSCGKGFMDDISSISCTVNSGSSSTQANPYGMVSPMLAI